MKKWMIWAVVIGLLVTSFACSTGSRTTPVAETEEPTEEVITEEPTEEEEEPTEEVEEPAGEPFQITVENLSPESVCNIYISSSEDENWGDNWLDEEIESGDSATFDIDAGGPHDVMIQNCDDIPVQTGWAIESDETVTVGGEDMIALQVTNESSVEVCYIMLTETDSGDEGEDLLGAKESIGTDGGERIFYLDTGTYDLLALDCDQEELVSEEGVDLDEDTTWTISDK